MPVFRCRDACHYGYLIFVPSQRTEDFVYAVTQFLKSLENSPLCSRLYCHWLFEVELTKRQSLVTDWHIGRFWHCCCMKLGEAARLKRTKKSNIKRFIIRR